MAETPKETHNAGPMTPLLKKKLDHLVEAAEKKGNILNRADIDKEFEGLRLREEHLNIISSYLSDKGVTLAIEDADDPYIRPDDSDSEDYTSSDEYKATQEPYNAIAAEEGDVTDSLRMYLREIGNIPLLTAQQEQEIGRKMEDGAIASRILTEGSLKDYPNEDEQHVSVPEDLGDFCTEEDKISRLAGKTRAQLREIEQEAARARTLLEESNLRLVVSVAKKYAGFGIPLADLIQEGNIGLMKAVDKFEYRKGYKFSTYASWWIRQAITRYLADTGRTIRIPVHMHEKYTKLSRISKQFLQEHGREATSEELAELMDISEEEVKDLWKISQDTVSLDSPVGDEDDSHLGDFIADGNMAEPFEATADTLLREQLEEILATLTEREQEILRLRVGFDNGRPMTLEEVGELYGLTRERIRQIEAKALRKLKHPKKSRLLADYI
ncbi:MAG: sigma-70 family RNA polymerase sigma factor [Lachnospiraceae bacterium]|nr:sigma-70 family RNA polymerase sigma factor [Lachnospiraceae bacterium]